jgi:RHS repeat-associated protein
VVAVPALLHVGASSKPSTTRAKRMAPPLGLTAAVSFVPQTANAVKPQVSRFDPGHAVYKEAWDGSPSGSVDATFTGYNDVTASTGTTTTPLLYDGQYRGPATRFDRLRARWYHPATDQFTSVDPDVADTAQPYTYAGDDPVSESDPTGLCGVTLTFASQKAGLMPCSNARGGVRAFNNKVGTVQAEQNPVTSTVRVTLKLSHLSQGILGPTVEVSGYATVTLRGKLLNYVRYSEHDRTSTYGYHFNIPTVPKGAHVFVLYVGKGASGESFYRNIQCVAIL